jgi:hypothetical protein
LVALHLDLMKMHAHLLLALNVASSIAVMHAVVAMWARPVVLLVHV